MTGFGEAYRETGSLVVAVEIRSVNNKYFKLTVRGPEGYASLESRIEQIVRRQVKRGTVTVQYRADRIHRPDSYRIDFDVLTRYRDQLQAVSRKWNLTHPVQLEALLGLPGVVQDSSRERVDPGEDWPVIESAVGEALNGLTRMRDAEGTALAAELAQHCGVIAENLTAVETLGPDVADGYRRRLAERVGRALADLGATVDSADLIREVALFGERSDICEEIARLKSHLEQFSQALATDDASGRKLEFLAQEMVREANTIGAKANSVEITSRVVNMKTAIERVREQVQNIE